MKNIKKLSAFFALCLLFVAVCVLPCLASLAESKNETEISSLASIAYRGDCTAGEQNSPEAVKSAAEKGADFISVSIEKRSDGFFLTGFDCTLSKAVSLPKNSSLILDDCFDYRDEILSLAKSEGFHEKLYFRTDKSIKKVATWLESNPEARVICVYRGNVVFNAISHFDGAMKLNMPLVQFQSKNYFNTFYQDTVTSRFGLDRENPVKPRVIAPCYDKDLSGQRSDDATGWDELIKRGFSVIETNNIDGLNNYIELQKKERSALKNELQKASLHDTALYSQNTAGKFKKAYNNALSFFNNTSAALSSLQEARSNLIFCANNLTLKDSTDTQKGTFNVTAGKIIAAVAMGIVIFSAQVYVFKMKKKGK